jgi:AcrR family transcriptional regulator
MAVKKQAKSRQASHQARSRAALIKSAQEVLGEIGPSATIEQLANHAQVSPTTIYKYFDNKEVLFTEALGQIWQEWVIWTNNGAPEGESLEAVVDTSRKLFWVKQTHPLFAKILHNTLDNPTFVIRAVRSGGERVFKNLAVQGVLENDDFEKRLIIYAYSLTGLLTMVHVTQELTSTEAETALGVSLSIWGISNARARKIISRPLVFP